MYYGTAKGAEGHAADIAFKQAKEEGMMIEVQWQDADLLSSKAFRIHKVMLCGGHMHTLNTLEKWQSKNLSETKQDSLKKKFPDVTKVRCHCPKRHRKNCGCISKSFLRGARTNFFIVCCKQKPIQKILQVVCLLWENTMPMTYTLRKVASVIFII